MAVNKINGYRAPYRSQTFRNIADSQTGLNGVLSIDGPVTQVGSVITIPAFTVIQQGLIYSKTLPTTKASPTTSNPPYYLVVTAPTPGNIDNLIFSFAQGLDDLTVTQVAIAFYDGYEWSLTPILSIEGIIDEIRRQNVTTGRVGPYYGLKTSIVGTGYTAEYYNSPGALIDKMGDRREFFENFIHPVIAADPDWRRVDRIVYRRPSDSVMRIGSRKFLLGGAYADTPAVLYTTNLFSSAATRNTPKVITDSENLAHVFATSGTGGSYVLTYARLSSDRQTVLESETTLITGLTDTEFDVVIDSNDFIYVLYVSGGDVIYQKMDATGTLIGTSLTLTGGVTGDCLNPRGKLDANDALYHIVFQSNTGSVNQIFYVSVDVDLSAIATTSRILIASANNLINPDICVSSDFVLHVAWENATTAAVYYQSFTTLLTAKITAVQVSLAVPYSEGGILTGGASSPRVIVADNLVPFVAFAQKHAGSNYGISVWSPEASYQTMLFNSSENFLYYDFLVEDIFNAPALIVSRTNSVDVVKLQNGAVDFSINLSVNTCNGVAFVKDRLGALVVAWADNTGGLFVGKTPAESYTMAYAYNELDSDLLLSRMIMPDEIIINWILGDKPGSFYDFLIAYGESVLIDWEVTAPDTITFGVGLNILDLFTDTNYVVTDGSYVMLEGEALYVILDGTGGTVIPQVLPLALVPWDSNAAVLGIIKNGEFNPVLLGMAGLTQLDSGESVIFGEDLPQSIRARLGIISETSFQAYTSTLAISSSDTYPQALSNLDIMAAQNRHARLVKYSGDWEVASANTLRLLADCYVQIPGLTEARNTIAAQSLLLANDGDIAYVNLNRTSGAASILAVTVAQASTVIPGRNTFVLARRTPTGVEIDGQAVTYTDRLSAGQANNIVQDGDTLEEAVKRLDVRQDVVKRVRVITRTHTSLPTGTSAIIDGETLVDGDKVLFADPGLNGIYQLSGVGASLVWTKLYEFAGSQTPSSQDLVMAFDGAEINRTIWAYDVTKSWYRATTVDDTVPVRAMDLTTTSLPSGSSLVVDGQTILEGELVLFGNAALNRVYRVSGIGSTISFEEMNVFTGDVAPRDGSTVLAQDGTVSDVIWEYNAELPGWVYLTITTQNKTYLGLTSPSKAGGTFVDQVSPGQLNNVVVEGDIIEEAIKRLDVRPDVLKRVRVIDLTTSTLPSGASVIIDGVTLVNGDKVLFGNAALLQGTGIFQVSGIGGGASWTKLFEFAGLTSPNPSSAVLVTEGTHPNRTVWLYNSAITPPWERVAGASENIWTGADAVTAPTFTGTLSSDDTDMSKVLQTLDKYFRSVQLREHPTDKNRVIITEADVTKTDSTTMSGILNGRITEFYGAQVDLENGNIYESDGVTLISTFTPFTVPDNNWYWYGISFGFSTPEGDNRILPVITIDGGGTSSALSKDDADKPTFTGDYAVGAVWVYGDGSIPGIEPVTQSNIVQISSPNNASVNARLDILETVVATHTTEINNINDVLGSILANRPQIQRFIATAGGQSLFDLTEFVCNADNAIVDIYVFWNGRWQDPSVIGDFSDGSYRKNSTTQVEMAETIPEGEEITVYIWDPAAIFVRTIKYQKFSGTGTAIFTLDPLIFTVDPDNTVIDCEYFWNGRWQTQSKLGDFSDGAARKNSSTEIELDEAIAVGQEFVVVQRVPVGSGSGGGGGGGSTDLENITVNLGFVTPKSVGTLAKPAHSLILKDAVTTDIWELTVASGAVQLVKIN